MAMAMQELSAVFRMKTIDQRQRFRKHHALECRLRKESRIPKNLPGFERIPVENSGLFTDEYRRRLPDDAETRRHQPLTEGHNGLQYDILDRPDLLKPR